MSTEYSRDPAIYGFNNAQQTPLGLSGIDYAQLEKMIADPFQRHVKSRFSETIHDLIPEVEQLEIFKKGISRKMEEQLEAAEQLPGENRHFIDKPSSEAKLLNRVSRSLMLSTGSIEEYDECVREAAMIAFNNIFELFPEEKDETDEDIDDLLESLRAQLHEGAETALATDELHRSIIKRFDSLSSSQKANLMLLICSRVPKDDEKSLLTIAALSSALTARLPINGEIPDSPMQQMTESLRKREYDKGIVEFMAVHPELTKVAPALQELARFVVAYSGKIGLIGEDQSHVASMAAMSDQLPGKPTEELHRFRKELVDNMVKLEDHYAQMIGNGWVLRDPKILVLQLANVLEAFIYVSATKGRDGTAEERAKERAKVSVRKNSLDQQRTLLDGIEKSEELVALQERRKVRAVKALGGSEYTTDYPEAKTGVETIIQEYLKDHRGAERLEENIRAAFTFLATADLSKPLTGMTKISNAEVNGTIVPLYELKPSNAQGVICSSSVMQNTRIAFVMTADHTAGLVYITDRKNAGKNESAQNGGGRRRRK